MSLRLTSIAILLAAVGTACGGGSSGPAPVASVTVTLITPLGVGQTSQASAVAKDANGGIVAGKTFTWSSLTPSVATISTSGLVTAVAVGTTTIQAACDGVDGTSSLSVVVPSGLPTQMAAVTATSQTGAPGSAATQAPAVIVRDANGVPVFGVPVTFVVTGGGGSITGGAVTTDALGKARITGWTFGPSGAQSVRATSESLPGIAVDFSGNARDPSVAFDITLRFISSMSDSQARAFVNARERIQQFIVGDLPAQNVIVSALQMVNCGGVAVQQEVDDVIVLAEVAAIDGVGNVLGQAGPCYLRSPAPGTSLPPPWPVIGHMVFDVSDLNALEAKGQLEDVILHEMMHVIGFGTIWTDMGLLQNPSSGAAGDDPTFSGANAIANLATYNNGAFYTGAKVPVENTGGGGTWNSHWREKVFNHELMTGFLDTGVNPISATTIGSFQDLGYTVDVTKADAFNLATALRMDWLSAVDLPLHLGNDVKPEPPGFIGPDGRPIGR